MCCKKSKRPMRNGSIPWRMILHPKINSNSMQENTSQLDHLEMSTFVFFGMELSIKLATNSTLDVLLMIDKILF